MQKKVIALALAGLVSGAAFAQQTSNLSIFGAMDAGPVRYFGSKNGTKAMTAIEQGRWSSVRIGFKGSEDLGDGLKVKFKMDIALYPVDKSKIKSKGGYVGLESKKFGEVLVGSVGTFADDLQGDISTMFGHDTLAAGDDVWMQTVGGTEDDDLKNAIAWYSPKWSGLQVKFAASTNAGGEDLAPRYDAAGGDDAVLNDRVYNAGLAYENGPLVAGAYYERSKVQSANDGTGNQKYDWGSAWGLGASYDFKFMRVHAVYNRMNFTDFAADEEFYDMKTRKQWQVGASFPVSAKGTFAVAYTKAKNEYLAGKGKDDDIKHFGIGYWYMLSKKTALYAAYGQISQSENNHRKTYFDEDGAYSKGIQTGLRYKF